MNLECWAAVAKVTRPATSPVAILSRMATAMRGPRSASAQLLALRTRVLRGCPESRSRGRSRESLHEFFRTVNARDAEPGVPQCLPDH